MVKKIIFFTILFFLVIFSIQAQDNQQTTDLQKKINEYQTKLSQLSQQKNTLSSQIQYMDTQIYLTGLQISVTEQKIVETEKEINLLGSRIEGLDQSLDYLSKQLIKRIVEGYKKRPFSIFSLLLDNKNANDFLNQVKYLKTAQTNNQKLLYTVQETKTNAEELKKLREEKKIELDKQTEALNYQKQSLNNQKVQKQRLLADTQNDEKVYQNLLAKAQAEYVAIQGIIAGAGTETKLKEVKKGENIASVISGASCNSSGGHLHFIVQQNNTVVNPFDYLKSTNYRNCSGSSCDSGDGDPFNPSGNLDWPLSPTIELSQGYGSTWAVRNTWVGRIYSFHNGIDINGSSNSVLAVADGTLYRGSYALGCTLSYTKLVHKDSNISTLYLHTYTQ
ncbi:MAG: peptidase M23 [Candidatus Roizmanbacteria bacterium GW2011_GWA2_34_18]|uniref:Peptidase M23 n=1 Tax=Candidatus Roizmanbacteria bacterium GW2011_GWA2_34_18 TaxID=1618477 RepID=A0A0G0AV92_9BACT|nr:MAG: peptidase M23 [Candidatus Roizmanbacteria bacterium GW2011_GWA2_34_18]